MKIGYDAKRAYHNATGLGNYSRLLISSLSRYFPEHQYLLFVAKTPGLFKPQSDNILEITPASKIDRIFPSYWRSFRIYKQIRDAGVDIYHGLSNELPTGLQRQSIKTVVTIHDLIFERYPRQYNPIDVRTYRAKAQYAVKHASRIVAASEQTRQDIIKYYKIKQDKIEVCYQACNPAFSKLITDRDKENIRTKYNLPPRYFLSVGSIIERKNLLAVCEAIRLVEKELDIPLVVIGNGGAYKKTVVEFIAKHGLNEKVIFLSASKQAAERKHELNNDLPSIYQCATALIYPSFFEGFGIPVLEALCSGLPVITSAASCLPEIGGNAALYIDPDSPQDIAIALKKVATDTQLAESMREKGWIQASNFTPELCAARIMGLYKKL
jgi:glycosyltransferase involved in cell wall biosynthesis